MNLRIPGWATAGGRLMLNGQRLAALASPGSYLALRRKWHDGDHLELELPMRLHTARMPDDERVQAAMYGPLVLTAALPADGLKRSEMFGRYRCWEKGKPASVPQLSLPGGELAQALEPIPNRTLRFRLRGQAPALEFLPLYQAAERRLGVYWKLQA